MKKIIVFFLILLIISNASIQANTNNDVQYQKIIYVDDDGGADYTLIQDAINNATNGDTIFVFSGIYFEHIIVNKSITLIGEDKNNTIIDGQHIGKVVTITANSVTIKGFKLKNCGENLSFRKNNTDTVIEIRSKNNNILNNIITWDKFAGLYYNPLGININLYSDNNNITNNEILQCINVIRLESSNNKICDNLIEMNGGDGIMLFTYSPNLPFCSKNNISNNIFYSINCKDFGLAIWCYHVKDNIISNNTISDVYGGIHIDSSSNNYVFKNNVSNCLYWGISVCNSNNNYILNNEISLNRHAGIYVGWGSYKNLIKNNNITKNRIGITLTNNKLNKFYQNNFIDNKRQVKFALRSILNHWKGNYWDNQIIHGFPKILFGILGRFIPWVNFDWRPAKQPYNI